MKAELKATTAMPTPEDVAQLRAQVMEGRERGSTIAGMLGVGNRMVYKYGEEGMPFIRIDGERWYHVKECIDWLSQRRSRRIALAASRPTVGNVLALAPRKPGRPRKTAE
jgi:hypothetical protein